MFAKNFQSLNSRVLATTMGVLSILVFAVGVSVTYLEFTLSKKSAVEIVKEKITIILKTNESDNYGRQYKNLSQKLFDLENINAVVLLDKECKPLDATPLNVVTPSCHQPKDPWQVFNNSSSLGPVRQIAVRLSSSYQELLWARLPYFLMALLGSLLLALVSSHYLSHSLFTKPITHILKKMTDIHPESQSPNIESVPEELRPLLYMLWSKRKDSEALSKALMQQKEDKALVDLARQTSHDIRSPLSALDVILKSNKSLSVNEAELLDSVFKRISGIAEELLDKSRVTPTYAPKPVKALIHPLELLMEEKCSCLPKNVKLKFSIDLSNHSKNTVSMNENLILRILSNLINNSIEAIREKPGIVNVSIRETNSNLCFTLKDSGPGFDKNILDSVLEGDITTKQSGNGLGLSSARDMISKHNGEMSISNLSPQGAMVEFYLPLNHQQS